ncbi:aldo/keto reductase [Pinirhizobacter soli]|uniref:aldo/keto reductase n=1 Tax=Pinirhizobacter soli TaxID=2786953 RepID=UPI00202A9645|nr:aldo/keto reductase [Pinirhizobacter soli]
MPLPRQAPDRPDRLRSRIGALSPLSFGAAPIGNLYAGVDDAVAQAAIGAALEAGITHFDTAPYYGYGLSESRLGEALGRVDRPRFTLSTKAGRLVEHGNASGNDGFAVQGRHAVFDYSRDGVTRSVEESLRRLRTDYIDILLLHDIGSLVHGEHAPAVLRQALDEALPAMASLRDQGICKAIGIGVNEESVCLDVMPRFELDTILLAGRFTLFEQAQSRRVMAMAYNDGVAVMAGAPYNSGLLGAGDGPGATYDYEPASDAIRARAQRYYDIGRAEHVDIGAAALQFPLTHPAVATVVCGLRSPEEVHVATQRMTTSLPATLWARLRDEGLVAA